MGEYHRKWEGKRKFKSLNSIFLIFKNCKNLKTICNFWFYSKKNFVSLDFQSIFPLIFKSKNQKNNFSKIHQPLTIF